MPWIKSNITKLTLLPSTPDYVNISSSITIRTFHRCVTIICLWGGGDLNLPFPDTSFLPWSYAPCTRNGYKTVFIILSCPSSPIEMILIRRKINQLISIGNGVVRPWHSCNYAKRYSKMEPACSRWRTNVISFVLTKYYSPLLHSRK